MQTVRLLLAVLIAISTVLLPIGCGVGQLSSAASAIVMTAGTDPPCCPSDHNREAPPTCVLQCVSIVAPGSLSFASLPFHATEKLASGYPDLPLDGEVVAPPRHPPRA